MLNSKYVIFFISIIILSLFSQIVYCEDAKKEYADVVVLLDSSGSMKKTDPINLRLPAARLFVSLLGKNDRVSIVSFDTKANTLIPLTMVKGDGNLSQLIKAIDKVPSVGLWTNIYDALDKAYELLDKNTRPKSQPIVILMSDGKMDTSDVKKDAELTESLKTTLLRKFKDKGIIIYTMAFSEESDKELLEFIAKATEGLFYVDLTTSNLHLRFTSVFENLKAPEMLPMQDNSFLVDKSVEEVTIVANKADPKTTITLISPTKKEYTAKSIPDFIKWSPSEQFDMITLSTPEVGRWSIKFSTKEGNKAYIVTNLKLQTDFDSQYVKLNEQININSWLVKDNANVTEREILSKITMTLELSHPDGKVEKIALYDNGEGIDKTKYDGKYAGMIKPSTPGQYTLKAKASGSTFERSQSFTFIVNKLDEKMPLTDTLPVQHDTENKDVETDQAKPLQHEIDEAVKPKTTPKEESKSFLGDKIKGLTSKDAVSSLININAILLSIVAIFLIIKRFSGRMPNLSGKMPKIPEKLVKLFRKMLGIIKLKRSKK